MKTLTLFAAAFFACSVSYAQIVICDTMPLAANTAAMTFVAAPSTFGDSMLYIPVTNNTSTNFAYPTAKLVALTPFPPGMSFTTSSLSWQTFASSYNTGQTEPAYFFFNVTQAIPVDYTVTFDLYMSNFQPLTVDSCVFASTVTVNFNPSSLSLNQASAADKSFTLSPNPATGEFSIRFQKQAGELNTIDMYDVNGKLVRRWSTRQSELMIHTGTIKSGMYYLISKTTLQRQKLIIAH